MSSASPGRLSRIAAAEPRSSSHPQTDSSRTVAMDMRGSTRSAHSEASRRTSSNRPSTISTAKHKVITADPA